MKKGDERKGDVRRRGKNRDNVLNKSNVRLRGEKDITGENGKGEGVNATVTLECRSLLRFRATRHSYTIVRITQQATS